jgi:hypothetical protein
MKDEKTGTRRDKGTLPYPGTEWPMYLAANVWIMRDRDSRGARYGEGWMHRCVSRQISLLSSMC